MQKECTKHLHTSKEKFSLPAEHQIQKYIWLHSYKAGRRARLYLGLSSPKYAALVWDTLKFIMTSGTAYLLSKLTGRSQDQSLGLFLLNL